MSNPPSWSTGDRPRWQVAPTDPARPAELTAPIPVERCRLCTDDDYHNWVEVDAERIGHVVLRRMACACKLCGQCDAQATHVDIDSQ